MDTESMGREHRPLLSSKEIQDKVNELAEKISKDYNGKELICIGILNGAYMFFTDLTRKITIPIECAFIGISSYNGYNTTGNTTITHKLTNSIKNKHVLIVEDIIDTGTTLYKSDIIKKFKNSGALSVKICSLLSKPSRKIYNIDIDYTGFVIDDHYVYGYGLDLDQLHRNLDYIMYIDNTKKE